MIGWCIVLLILLLILIFPVGADAAYSREGSWLTLKLGPFRKTLLPGNGKEKPEKKKHKKENKKEAQTAPEEAPPKKKRKLRLDDLLTFAEIALDTLRRTCAHLSIDLFCLDWTAAAADPYAAVVQYGRVNAVLGALSGPAHRVFHFRKEDVRTSLDFEAEKPAISARLVLSLQIWEILLIAICAGIAGLRWYLNKKRTERAALESDAGKEPA